MDKSPTPALDRRIAELAAFQHGVVRSDQLLALGCGRGAIDLRVRNPST